jgi:hypothetical protein
MAVKNEPRSAGYLPEQNSDPNLGNIESENFWKFRTKELLKFIPIYKSERNSQEGVETITSLLLQYLKEARIRKGIADPRPSMSIRTQG